MYVLIYLDLTMANFYQTTIWSKIFLFKVQARICLWKAKTDSLILNEIQAVSKLFLWNNKTFKELNLKECLNKLTNRNKMNKKCHKLLLRNGLIIRTNMVSDTYSIIDHMVSTSMILPKWWLRQNSVSIMFKESTKKMLLKDTNSRTIHLNWRRKLVSSTILKATLKMMRTKLKLFQLILKTLFT